MNSRAVILDKESGQSYPIMILDDLRLELMELETLQLMELETRAYGA